MHCGLNAELLQPGRRRGLIGMRARLYRIVQWMRDPCIQRVADAIPIGEGRIGQLAADTLDLVGSASSKDQREVARGPTIAKHCSDFATVRRKPVEIEYDSSGPEVAKMTYDADALSQRTRIHFEAEGPSIHGREPVRSRHSTKPA